MNIDWTIERIIKDDPGIRDFFMLKGLYDEEKKELAAGLKLKSALKFRRIEAPAFLLELDAYQKSREQALRGNTPADECDFWGRIPCMVQLPVQNALDAFLAESRLPLKYDIGLVEFGKDWIDGLTAIASPPVVVGAGIEGMIRNTALSGGQYREPVTRGLNPDFAGFEDPKKIFRMLSGIPLVFVVDRQRLAGRTAPAGWADILKDEFYKSVCYPDDGHLLDGVFLVYLYQLFGLEGVLRFGANCICGAHPSQMIKINGLDARPAVYIMPYIFAGIKTKEEGMEMVWPCEGAPVIPLVCTARRDMSEDQKMLAEFICGAECGEIFMHQGFFPSSDPRVSNCLPGKLWWLGFEYLYKHDVLEIIEASKKIFLEEQI